MDSGLPGLSNDRGQRIIFIFLGLDLFSNSTSGLWLEFRVACRNSSSLKLYIFIYSCTYVHPEMKQNKVGFFSHPRIYLSGFGFVLEEFKA